MYLLSLCMKEKHEGTALQVTLLTKFRENMKLSNTSAKNVTNRKI